MRETVTTLNIDWANTSKEHAEDIAHITKHATVACLQECRDDNLSKIIPKEWRDNQVRRTAATRGSAIIWDDRVWDRRRSRLVLGVDNFGVRMHPRWISIVKLEHLETGQVIRFISMHVPPGRYRWLQPRIIDSLVAVIKLSRRPTVVGADFNFRIHNDPYHIAKRTNMERRGHGVDGFFVSKMLKVSSIFIGKKLNSGHRPLSVTIDL